MIEEKVEQFLTHFTQWASSQEDIQALALVGSHARDAATETSDVDLILIALDPKRYLENMDWAQRFGTVEKQQTGAF